jgi:hypothetical protein
MSRRRQSAPFRAADSCVNAGLAPRRRCAWDWQRVDPGIQGVLDVTCGGPMLSTHARCSMGATVLVWERDPPIVPQRGPGAELTVSQEFGDDRRTCPNARCAGDPGIGPGACMTAGGGRHQAMRRAPRRSVSGRAWCATRSGAPGALRDAGPTPTRSRWRPTVPVPRVRAGGRPRRPGQSPQSDG